MRPRFLVFLFSAAVLWIFLSVAACSPSPGVASRGPTGQGPAQQGTQVPEATAQPTAVPAEPQQPSVSPARPAAPFVWPTATPRFGVAEAFRRDSSTELGISWERNVFSWADIQPKGPDDWRADFYFPPDIIQQERDRGIEIVGVLQFTPTWAAAKPEEGHRSVPRNLSLPFDDPDNYWGRFTNRLAAHYKGRIDRWIIWNEPEFKPGDKGVGSSYSWLGSDAEYYMLLKKAYQGIKSANPKATVVFSGTSYWVDVNMGRRPFFHRLLDIAAKDPQATGRFFFDAVAINLYRCPDDLYRIYHEMKDAMKAKGIDKPIWLTETNAMPHDDPATPKPADGQRVTLQQQSDYLVQGLALASAAGYEWISWYRIDDGGIWRDQEVWGLVRDDGSRRPAFQTMKTALELFTGAREISFVPLMRKNQPFGTPWPKNPDSYYPNWQVYQVVFDHPDGRRVTVLWNADGKPVKVWVPRQGIEPLLVDKTGTRRSFSMLDGWYAVDLEPATATGPMDPVGYHYIGGPPVILVEQKVPPETPIQEPRMAGPASS